MHASIHARIQARIQTLQTYRHHRQWTDALRFFLCVDTDIQTYRHTDIQTYRHACEHAYIHADTQTQEAPTAMS